MKGDSKMLVGKIKLGNGSTGACGSTRVAPRKSSPKVLGTRAGTLQDWRQGSRKSEEDSGRRRNRRRDGR